MRRTFSVIFACLLSLLSAQCISQSYIKEPRINVAVASNFLSTAKILLKEFESRQKAPVNVKLISASTGQLSHQILNGAPFDLFLAANDQHPKALQSQLNLAKQNVKPYAFGKLVFVSRTPTGLKELNLNSLQAFSDFLNNPANASFAIANEKLAPYGKASMEVLKRLNLTKIFKTKAITGQNIIQTFQFFHSGNTQGAFVAKALLTPKLLEKNPNFNVLEIDNRLHNPIKQSALLVSKQPLARNFLTFILSHDAQSIIQQHGYGQGL
jgi:molybdenum ABC transporter molybdate-binding protein